jgi:Bacteriophage Gp15 protein.
MFDIISMTEHNDNNGKRLVDWEQDFNLITASINKVLNAEVRAIPYMHWWTYLCAFNEMPEGTFLTVLSIRYKKQNGKKLEEWEKDFYKKIKI